MIVKVKENKKMVYKKKRFDRDNLQLFLLNLPSLIWVLIFSYLPMYGLVIAFKKYRIADGILGSAWCGFDNFEFLVKSNTMGILLRNTILYNVSFIILQHVITICLALLLYNITKSISIKILQSCMFLPYLLSWIVVSYISYALLKYDGGIFNQILAKFNIAPIAYYNTPSFWPFYLTSFGLWKAVGFVTLVYYGSILSVDTELLEAAAIDGCTYMQRIWYIMVPHLKATVAMLLILSVGSILHSDYGLFYYLPQGQGQLQNVTDTLDTYVMRSVRVTANYGGSSAAGFFQSIVGCVLVVGVNMIIKKLDEDSSLF